MKPRKSLRPLSEIIQSVKDRENKTATPAPTVIEQATAILPPPVVVVPAVSVKPRLDFGPIHQQFLADMSAELCFEGARFSGKTWACCAKIVQFCQQYPGIECLICRYSNEESQKALKPDFIRICHLLGEYPDPVASEDALLFSNGSKVYISGLRSQGKLEKQAKVRGRTVAVIWNDQSEEVPQDVGEEVSFGTRQPGFPHQTIFSPNPPDEDHWLADMFPDDNSIAGRKCYRVSLYDNPHCPEDKLIELEQKYPKTHARYKTLVLGLRGPSVSGIPVYDEAFSRELHVQAVPYDRETLLLEAIDAGRHHPVWMATQRNYFGGFEIQGAIVGKHMFLEDFLPIIDRYRLEWFGTPKDRLLCTDPPMDTHQTVQFSNVQLLREAGIPVTWTPYSNAPDVREGVIQGIASLFRRRLGKRQAITITDDPTRWRMVSHVADKQHKFFIDGCEASYVWDEHFVSVGNKKVRQPLSNQWVDGAQRCLENLVLNFGRRRTQQDAENEARQAFDSSHGKPYRPVSCWS